MNYAEMLNQIIDQSGLSLRQIAKRCKELDLSITPSYISQLKNAKLPPPTEEVSLTIAKVCGSKKQAELVFQGYMEKAPAMVKEYMLASSALNKAMLSALCKTNSEEFTEEMEAYINSLDVLSALDLSSEFVSSEDPLKTAQLIMGVSLSAGMPVKPDSKGGLIQLFLLDTSMQPLIPMHAGVYILPTRPELLKDRDIVAFYPDGRKTAALRRIHFTKDRILLIPEDRNHEIYMVNDLSSINYIGKVVSYKIDL